MEAVKLAYDLYISKNCDPELHPFIVLHGLHMNRMLFKHMAQKLAEKTRRKVYCVDLRSHGESPSPEESNIYLMAEDILLFLEDHNIAKAVIVCHSFSSRIGTVFSIDNPDKVENFIIIDFFPYQDLDRKYNEFSNTIKATSMKLVEHIDLQRDTEEIKKEIREKFAQNKQTSWVLAFLEILVEECVIDEQGIRLKYDRDATLKFFLAGRYRLPPYGVYDKPVLFMVVEKSGFCGVKDEEIMKYFPKAQCHVFHEASHLLPVEDPDACSDVIHAYLQGKMV